METGGIRVILLSASRTRSSRLASDLREYSLRAWCPDESREEVEVKPGEILVTYGNLHRGFEYPMIKFIVITEGDMFGVEKKNGRGRKPLTRERRFRAFPTWQWETMWFMRTMASVYTAELRKSNRTG